MKLLLAIIDCAVYLVGLRAIFGWVRRWFRRRREAASKAKEPKYEVISSSAETWINGKLHSREIDGETVFSRDYEA